MNEPIVAYRMWPLDGHHICSLRYKMPWTPGCIMTSDVIPLTHYSNGIHAFRNGYYALQYCTEFTFDYVIGEVYLWGKIVEHEFGYRAEFAYPKRIEFIFKAYNCYDDKIKTIENNLCNSYGCDVDDLTTTKAKLPFRGEGSLWKPANLI